ncbi:hypothetical protein F4604DRAFT_1686106 [Suillus subluteus]|nr:hypothetical protein F4604DRAFT_1686106 [Suillus subluteus]
MLAKVQILQKKCSGQAHSTVSVMLLTYGYQSPTMVDTVEVQVSKESDIQRFHASHNEIAVSMKVKTQSATPFKRPFPIPECPIGKEVLNEDLPTGTFLSIRMLWQPSLVLTHPCYRAPPCVKICPSYRATEWRKGLTPKRRSHSSRVGMRPLKHARHQSPLLPSEFNAGVTNHSQETRSIRIWNNARIVKHLHLDSSLRAPKMIRSKMGIGGIEISLAIIVKLGAIQLASWKGRSHLHEKLER